MIPSSDDLESLHDRIKEIDGSLKKLKGAEVKRAELITALATVAREWLRVSPALKADAATYLPSLDPYDQAMSDVLASTKQRSRASAYRAKLRPFLNAFLDTVIVPLIRFEGSPSQVAARQLEAVFEGALKPEEQPYVQEAARCSGVHCHRAALVLLWAAGIARLHNAVQTSGFAAFNAAAATSSAKKGSPYNRITKSLVINSLAELQRTRDFDIIAIGMDLWKYDIQCFEELDRLLGTRNSAAHPGMFQPGALDVRQFADKVRRYVLDKVQ